MGRISDRIAASPTSPRKFSPKPYLSVLPTPMPGKKEVYTFHCKECGKDLEHGPPIICKDCGACAEVPGSMPKEKVATMAAGGNQR